MHTSLMFVILLFLVVLTVAGIFVIRAILIRKAVTAAITGLFALLYWLFPADILVDPLFIGHVVTALILLNSMAKISGKYDKLPR